MQKSIVISALIFIVLSCGESNTNTPAGSGASTDTALHQDTVRQALSTPQTSGSDSTNTKKVFPVSKDIVMVNEKLSSKAILDKVDYGIIGTYLTDEKDESLSEGVGQGLYEYFKGNGPANEQYAAFLNKKGNAYQEKILGKFVGIMCIDLGLENYTYDKLVTDFPLCNGSKAAEAALKRCIDNRVGE